MKQKLLEGL